MSGLKDLVGKRITKKYKFMGEEVVIRKLSVAEVLEIQSKAAAAEKNEKEGFQVLETVVKLAVEGAEDLSSEDFETFPLEELTKLANEVMQFSGMTNKEGK